MERVESIVRSHGKRMIGWEEVAKTKLRRTSVAQHWHDPALARRAVEQGAKLVMSPAPKAYLDMKYTPRLADRAHVGGHDLRAGRLHLGSRDAGPRRPRARHPRRRGAALDGDGRDARRSSTTSMFPRLLGQAEIAWSPAAGRTWRRYDGGWRRTGRVCERSASRSTRRPRCPGAERSQAGPGDRAAARVEVGAGARAPVARPRGHARPRRRRPARRRSSPRSLRK